MTLAAGIEMSAVDAKYTLELTQEATIIVFS